MGLKIMTAELGAASSPDFVATLSKRCAGRRDKERALYKAVVNALLQAEK